VAERVTGVILAGGQASRYGGRPKGLERVHGRRIIDRVADALAPTDELLLIANDPEAARWLPGVRCEPDVEAGLGSLGGIHSALVRAGGAVLVVACDMPFVPASLVAELRSSGSGADAALPASGSKRGVEPLCAFYAASCAPAIAARLAAGDRRVVSFFDDLRDVRVVPPEIVARHGDPRIMFMNVNSPEELALAEAHASSPDGGDRRPEA
jgi:molybdopterin-guanine dinucleotide biosynthesis protein A